MAMSVLPLRALHFIQRSYPAGTFETTLSYLFHCFFTPPHTNVTDAATLQKTLREVPSEFDAASSSAPPASRRPPPPPPPLFSAREVDAIMRAATSQEAKDQLRAATDEALRRGAFGCPWFWVTDATGHAEAFFGSDRFHFMYKFLGLPFRDIALLPPSEAGTHGGQAKL
ncbi:hypothetical protein VTK73DRAFT_5695 [Phialemonium thermophilum]|uniref:DSBA-like thioredoxin domain-containing protein n=1 Tax=Phialemonium thermophilum TaxID=223376 RepID=A0ABR3V0S1_9PEZI